MALCFCIFLHPLCWLLFLDNRPPCYGRRVVGGGPTPVGESGGIAGSVGDSFRADSPPPSSPLRVDGYPDRRGGFARFKACLSQLGFLSRTSSFVLRFLYFCVALSAPPLGAAGQRWKSPLHDLD